MVGNRQSNYCTHGNDSYSYDTCIRTTLPDGATVGNVTKYSATTSKHQKLAAVHLCNILVNDAPVGVTAEQLRQLGFAYRKAGKSGAGCDDGVH